MIIPEYISRFTAYRDSLIKLLQSKSEHSYEVINGTKVKAPLLKTYQILKILNEITRCNTFLDWLHDRNLYYNGADHFETITDIAIDGFH